MLPLLTLGLALDGLGQMMGYLFGAGTAVARVAAYEFHRFEHITAADRAQLGLSQTPEKNWRMSAASSSGSSAAAK